MRLFGHSTLGIAKCDTPYVSDYITKKQIKERVCAKTRKQFCQAPDKKMESRRIIFSILIKVLVFVLRVH